MATYPHNLIIGGGAAGLTAGVLLLRAGARVTLVERGSRVGKKLLATGNGTCNVGNRRMDISHYHGAAPSFAEPALAACSPDDAAAFLSSVGVETVSREDGRVYPRSLQAAAVLDCLRTAFAALGGELQCDTEIVKLTADKQGVTAVSADGARFAADNVLVCTGGAASPSCGGFVGGYALLEQLGHTRTPLFAAVVPLKTDTTFVKSVKGIRADVALTLQINGRAVASHSGELLFTEYGLSGPVVMQISRVIGDFERKPKGLAEAVIDLLPDLSKSQLIEMLRARRTLDNGARAMELFFTGLLHNRIGQTVVRMANLSLSAPVSSLTDAQIARLVDLIKGWTIPVTGTTGLAHAQVTAGGIATADFDPHTLRSRKAPRVFAAGEVLDIDGDCGGYNLHFAIASAHLAARGMLL